MKHVEEEFKQLTQMAARLIDAAHENSDAHEAMQAIAKAVVTAMHFTIQTHEVADLVITLTDSIQNEVAKRCA